MSSSRRQDAHKRALVLACMDYRLVGAVADYMAGRGFAGRYDLVTIAGGGMGVVEGDAAWTKTFFDHLALALELHAIEQVVLIDHRDCGACKAIHGPDCADDLVMEEKRHAAALRRLAQDVRTRHPELALEGALMDVDGSVQPIALDPVDELDAT